MPSRSKILTDRNNDIPRRTSWGFSSAVNHCPAHNEPMPIELNPRFPVSKSWQTGWHCPCYIRRLVLSTCNEALHMLICVKRHFAWSVVERCSTRNAEIRTFCIVRAGRNSSNYNVTKHTKQTNSVALSPQANYTDWMTATCWRNLVPTFVDRGVSRGQHGGSPTVVNLSFIDRSRYFSFK
jgi:hypothetical protein